MSVYDLYQSYLNQKGPAVVQPVQPSLDIVSLYPQNYQGDGDGYSVYNPDPNMTRTSRNYNPRPAYETAFGTMMGDPEANIATGALNKFDVMGSYQEKPPSGLETLFNQYVKSSLPAQLLGKGIEGLANMLPVSKTGILQNELLGAGFMLDNTGRIVANDYNTPQGIMAGYNPVSGGALNFITGGKMGEPTTYGLDKAYDKRRETVAKTLKEKYGMTDEEIEAAIAGEYEGDVPINPITGKPTDLINRLDLFNQSQNLFNKKLSAADIIYNRKVEERKEKELEKQRQEQMAREADTAARARAKNQNVYREADRQGFTNDRGGFSTSAADRAGTSAGSGQFSPSTSRGRSGY
jgi:hypothetical protein